MPEQNPRYIELNNAYESIDKLLQKSDDPVIKKLLQIAEMVTIIECADVPEDAKKTFYATFSEIYNALADEMPHLVKGNKIQCNYGLKNMFKGTNKENIDGSSGDSEKHDEIPGYGSIFKRLADYYAQKAGLEYKEW